MARYRKKPVVIEATQFTGDMQAGTQPLPDGVVRGDSEGHDPGGFYVRTLEGDMRVNVRDFVITGVKGERYPCKPDIFEATYDAVAERDAEAAE